MKQKLSRESIQEKIQQGSVINRVTNCWEWVRGTRTAGYGDIFNGADSVVAHKASFKAFYGDIPSSKKVLVTHKCNNAKCVNPEHLKLGTKKGNTYDALMNKVYPTRRVLTKLDREFIKYLYLKGLTMRFIVKMYLTNHPQISRTIKESDYAFS